PSVQVFKRRSAGTSRNFLRGPVLIYLSARSEVPFFLVRAVSSAHSPNPTRRTYVDEVHRQICRAGGVLCLPICPERRSGRRAGKASCLSACPDGSSSRPRASRGP